MSKRGGKGRVSHELVAASCAAVLAVYAAGYWRTRDAARQMEAQSRERRPPRPEPRVVAAPAPASVALPGAAPVSVPAVSPTTATAPVPVAEVKPAKQIPAEAVAPTPQIQAEPPVAPAVALIQPPSPDNVSTPATAPAPVPGPLPEGFQGWRDGTYTGRGTSYHGDIEVEVVIQGGRIVKSGISGCYTRYSCGVIEQIINQPVARQSPDVDKVSGATESADAYYYGVLDALASAEPPTETPLTPK